MVLVGDDCALKNTGKLADRRGLCGTILVHKVCGVAECLESTTTECASLYADSWCYGRAGVQSGGNHCHCGRRC